MTRHIDEELERNDWDVMVLHYLGLDHIGHVEGPRSLLVQPKLSEMDEIVQRVVSSLQQQVLDPADVLCVLVYVVVIVLYLTLTARRYLFSVCWSYDILPEFFIII